MFKNIIGLFNPYAPKTKKQPTQEEFYRDLEIDTLARTIFGEARSESVAGMEAVASVVLNRARISAKKRALLVGEWNYWGVPKALSI